MNLPAQYKKIIIDEFQNVYQLCKKINNADDKLYFFSAAYGVVQRVINFHYDPLLTFIHQILQSIHLDFSQRRAQINPGTIVNCFPEESWEKLFLYFADLIDTLEDNDDVKIREILEKLTNHWYATTGNGFYLYLNEKIKL